MAGIASAFRWPMNTSIAPLTLPKAVKIRAKNLLGVLSVLSLLATLYRWPANAPRPHRPGPRILRAGIWTVHFGIDNEGRDSQRRMRDLIGYITFLRRGICESHVTFNRDMELDVVGLLETDLQVIDILLPQPVFH